MAAMKEVWTTCPRGEGKKDFWLRVGTAFENRDGSWSIVLDALPVSGRLIVREPREDDRAQAPRNGNGNGGQGRRPQQRQSPPPADDDFDYGHNRDDGF